MGVSFERLSASVVCMVRAQNWRIGEGFSSARQPRNHRTGKRGRMARACIVPDCIAPDIVPDGWRPAFTRREAIPFRPVAQIAMPGRTALAY
jgi:hypothetical protein